METHIQNQIIYILSGKYKTMMYTVKKHNIPLEPDWNDFNEFIKDVYDGFVEIYKAKPKRIFLKRINQDKGYLRDNVYWSNSNVSVMDKHSVPYILNGKPTLIKDIALHFGWNLSSTTYFIKKYTIEEVNEIINSDSPERLFDKKKKVYTSDILYQGKIYSLSGLVRFFKSKRVRLSKQLLSIRVNRKRKQLNLGKYDVVPMETQELIANRNRTWILNKRLVAKVLEEFQKEM